MNYSTFAHEYLLDNLKGKQWLTASVRWKKKRGFFQGSNSDIFFTFKIWEMITAAEFNTIILPLKPMPSNTTALPNFIQIYETVNKLNYSPDRNNFRYNS